MTTCPKCERALGYVTAAEIDIKAPRVKWPGITLSCPHCSACLGVSMDPIKFANQMLDAIRKGRAKIV